MASTLLAPDSSVSRQWELKPAPTDGVTDLCFCPASDDILASSSWDSVCLLPPT